jgi:type II secretory pathway pseudopilin PulG
MRPRADRTAFTLIELLIVMSIIIVLAGLILATSGYVQNKGYRSRAEAEIAAMSAALESYKADNGLYPSDASTNAADEY